VKQIIRKILKEDKQEKYYQLIIDYVEKNDIWDVDHLVEMFGLGKNDIDYFEGEALRHLNELEGMSFDTNNYPLRFGSYEIEFIVKRIVDMDSFYKGQREIEVVAEIKHGLVDIEGETIDVLTATTHDDYGWEVESEIGDCIRMVIRYLIPEVVPGKIHIDVTFAV
jgi:hypothetical protein